MRAGGRARLWFVTQGAQAISPQERVSVDLAACWGAARVVGEEHPDLWGGLADIGPGDAAALARHLLQDDGEDQVAFRGGRRSVLRLLPSEAASTPYDWREDGTYLFTGGLGGVGLQMALCAVQAGARRLLLLGRTALPARETWSACPPDAPQALRIAAIRALEARGVAVHTASVDVADEAAMHAVLALHRAQGLPPIRGGVHAAAENVAMLVRDSDPASFGRGLAAKLRGAQVLDRLLPDVELFALVSSATAVVPHPGIAAYAAANAGLDALAQDRCARGLAALSIGWGPWERIGLASATVGAHVAQDMARIGVKTLPAASAGEAFIALCGATVPYQAVVDVDWHTFRRARPGRSQAIVSGNFSGISAEAGGFSATLAATPAPARAALVETLVRGCVSQVLRLAPERLDAEAALGEFGLTSLMAIELCHRLEQAAGCPVPATLAWNYPTIKAISGYVSSLLTPTGAVASTANAAPIDAVDAVELETMSDEQALELLMGART
jgi:acyl carrier protein